MNMVNGYAINKVTWQLYCVTYVEVGLKKTLVNCDVGLNKTLVKGTWWLYFLRM